jgi:hypothetical protein
VVNAWEVAKITESAWNELVRIGIKEGRVKIDDIAEMYAQKMGTNPSYVVLQTLQGTITQNMSLPGRLAAESKAVLAAGTAVGEKAGSYAKSKVVPFVSAHPTISASLASAAAGGLVVAALQRQGAVTAPTNPYDFNVPYDPNNVVLNPGTVTNPTTITQQQDETAKKDYGIVGNALAWTGSTLFGQTGEEIGNFVDGAKPWVLGAGVIVAIVAVGYAATAIHGNRSTLRVETSGMAGNRQ